MVNVQRGLTARIIREGAGEESVFIAEHGFYCYLVSAGSPAPVLQVMLQKVSQEIATLSFETGREFEDTLLEKFKKAGAPPEASIACVSYRNSRLFVLTQNQGELYIQRGGKTIKLLDGNRHAMGALQDDDVFILSTSASASALNPQGGWGAYLEGSDISALDISGLILTTSVVEVEEVRGERRNAPPVKEKKERKPPAFVTNILAMDRRRLLMLGGLGFIALLLVASLAFGLIRRASDRRLKQIAYTKDEVAQKLQQAEDVAFLNSGRAAGLINDAKHDISELKASVGGGNTKEIKELQDMVSAKESTIFKKEDKQPSEFFDLAVEDKNAHGTLMARSGDRAAIVNPDGTVYILNLEKKSLDKQASGVKNAVAVALGDTSTFVLGTNGVVQIDEDGKAKKVIEKDSDWGTVAAMAVFNNNVYLLDSGKGLITKYTPTADGYGGKSSYIKGNGPSLVGAKSIAIDASVYAATENALFKFTSGLQDGFAPQFPDGGITITKIDSAEDVEKVYGWDKPRGLLYIVSKNGSYERQIKSAAFKKADDVVVSKDTAYLLQGQKIYKIPTN
ncbi:hypothetical protein HYS00_05475 [Candidatus Microgenomates bacterium]|nr:hypothetical protein [Candidatus Microgenomates bacterium]